VAVAVLARQWRQLSDVELPAAGGDEGLALSARRHPTLQGDYRAAHARRCDTSSPAEGIVVEIFASRCIRKR